MGALTSTYLRDVRLAGMNFVLAGAAARGFVPGDPSWINLGQGQPEIGDLPGAPDRVTRVDLVTGDHAYGPVNGLRELRSAVADHYNRLYRTGAASRYTADNVAIVAGGRPALNRVVAALGAVELGYMLPDYAAYEDIIDRNRPRVTPIGLSKAGVPEILASGPPALLISNPRNPTGELIEGADLDALVAGCVAAGRALILDEFYSHYIWVPGPDGAFRAADRPVSAAAYVSDVDSDPVILIDGLTKNFRYPGWRLGWVVGPRDLIATLERVGQAMDGGVSQLVQRAALAVLEPSRADAETAAVRAAFARKRNLTVDGLRAAGVRVDVEPRGTFYVWGDVGALPAPLNTADGFFAAALDRKVITVPGHAFDLDPGGLRGGAGLFDTRVRFSFGPAAGPVAEGLARLAEMVAS